MNRLLVSIAGGLNVVVFILIVIGGAIIGYQVSGSLGVFIGVFVGLFVAVLVCEETALIIDIGNSLRQLVELNRAPK